jgi:hypothetical protein
VHGAVGAKFFYKYGYLEYGCDGTVVLSGLFFKAGIVFVCSSAMLSLISSEPIICLHFVKMKHEATKALRIEIHVSRLCVFVFIFTEGRFREFAGADLNLASASFNLCRNEIPASLPCEDSAPDIFLQTSPEACH